MVFEGPADAPRKMLEKPVVLTRPADDPTKKLFCPVFGVEVPRVPSPPRMMLFVPVADPKN